MSASFSTSLKAELTKTRPQRSCCRRAALSAVLHTAGSLTLTKGGFSAELSTKSEAVAEFALKLLGQGYPEFSERDFLAGETNGCGTLKFSQEFSRRMLEDLRIVWYDENGETHVERGIAPELVSADCCKKQYIKGSFLGCGTVKINRSSGYHLEFNFAGEVLCAHLASLLNELGFRFKYAERKDGFALYLKDGEEISDFLAYLGASVSVMELQELLLERQKSNSLNRQNNCYIANVDKSFDASIRQVAYISVLEANLGLENLGEDLRKTCEARLDHPDISMAELAELLHITKSGAGHRLRKIRELASKYM